MGRIGRIGCAVVVLLVLALGMGAYWAWDRARSAPEWYAPPSASAPQVVALAEAVEYRLAEEAQRIRPPEDSWTLRVRDEQVNAWLSARLPEWLEHEHESSWPDDLGTPQVRIEEDGVSLAIEVRVRPDAPPQVVVARVRPTLTDAGLALTVDRVGLGRLMLPGAGAQRVAELLERAASGGGADGGAEAIATISKFLGGTEPIPPTFDLADGRAVELIGLRLGKGTIDLSNRTIPPNRSD